MLSRSPNAPVLPVVSRAISDLLSARKGLLQAAAHLTLAHHRDAARATAAALLAAEEQIAWLQFPGDPELAKSVLGDENVVFLPASLCRPVGKRGARRTAA